METNYFEIAGIALFFLGIGIVIVIDIVRGGSENRPSNKADPYFFKVTHRTVLYPGGINPFASALSNDSRLDEMLKGRSPQYLDPDHNSPWPHEANPHVAPPLHVGQRNMSDQ